MVFLSSYAFGIEAFVSEAFRIAYYHCCCLCCCCCCSTVLIRKPIIFNAVYRCCFCFLPSRHRNKKKWKVTRKESDFCSLANKDRTMRTLCMGNIICILYTVQCTATKVYVYMCTGIRTECCAVMWCAVLCAVCCVLCALFIRTKSNPIQMILYDCVRAYTFFNVYNNGDYCTTNQCYMWYRMKKIKNGDKC